jgi:predicted GIY-YIG superfamily endonuclease
LPNHFSPSGASLCSRCGADQTSKAGAASCDFIPCVPSAFDPAKFKCYSDLEKVTVVIGYVFSTLSSLFSVYKLRIFVLERIQKLKEANITPTLRRIVFLERTLANHSKHLLLSLAHTAGTFDETTSSSEVVRMVRDVQRQFQEQQQQQEQSIRCLQEQTKQQQEQLIQQQQQIPQLMQQLQRSQQ